MSDISLDPVTARDRVADLLDEGESLHGVVLVGADEQDSGTVHYAIAVLEREHEGETYLNERYVMLPEDSTGMSDTFLKNGINRRFVAGLHERLANVYANISDRRERGSDLKPQLSVIRETGTVDPISEVDDGR